MAGHGSPPAPDRANDSGRQVGRIVSNVASTQPRPMGRADKFHPESLIVQRVRRERPQNGGILTNQHGTTVLPPKLTPSPSGTIGPSSVFNPDASPATNRMASEADENVRRSRMRFGG